MRVSNDPPTVDIAALRRNLLAGFWSLARLKARNTRGTGSEEQIRWSGRLRRSDLA
jgi:hypothetical protein